MKTANKSGFSLIEVMAVIVIITIAMSVAVMEPFGVIEEQKLRSVIQSIHLSIRDAKAKAILRNEEVLMRFDLARNHISVESLFKNDIDIYNYEKKDARRDYYRNHKGEVLSDWPIEEGVELVGVFRGDELIENQVALILFSPEGTSDSFRLKINIPQSEHEMAFEVRGLMGQLSEVPVEDFRKEWDDIDSNMNPVIIDFDTFYEDGSPTAYPAETAGDNDN